jgi:hypothetical protein
MGRGVPRPFATCVIAMQHGMLPTPRIRTHPYHVHDCVYGEFSVRLSLVLPSHLTTMRRQCFSSLQTSYTLQIDGLFLRQKPRMGLINSVKAYDFGLP